MSADARFTPQPGGSSYLSRAADRSAFFTSADSQFDVMPLAHHFAECWEHSDTPSYSTMIRATRDLLDGKAVCDDPDHAEAWGPNGVPLAEWLDIAEQNNAITRKG